MVSQKMMRHWCMLLLLPVFVTFTALAFDPTVQTPSLLLDEALTVYYGNLARREVGQSPLRWNRQLTYASRWFAWDSVENRSSILWTPGHQRPMAD